MNEPLLANPRLLCGTRLGEEMSQIRKIEKFNREKEKSENLKELKSRLNFIGCSETLRYSESKTMDTKEREKRHRSMRSRSPRTSVFSRIRRERSRSPRQRSKEGGVFKRIGSGGKCVRTHQTATAETPIPNTQKLSQE
ncbi:hypothetical protein Tco_1281785 [Tanacetum coccineum]